MTKGRRPQTKIEERKAEVQMRRAISTYNTYCGVAEIRNWHAVAATRISRCEECERPVLPAEAALVAWNAIQGGVRPEASELSPAWPETAVGNVQGVCGAGVEARLVKGAYVQVEITPEGRPFVFKMDGAEKVLWAALRHEVGDGYSEWKIDAWTDAGAADALMTVAGIDWSPATEDGDAW